MLSGLTFQLYIFFKIVLAIKRGSRRYRMSPSEKVSNPKKNGVSLGTEDKKYENSIFQLFQDYLAQSK